MSPEISNRKIIALIGPEGSGKSEQARLLSQKLQIPHISSGEIIRERAETDTGEFGEACRDALTRHVYLDDTIASQIAAERVSRDDTENGFILDGGFRTTKQVREFQHFLKKTDREMPVNVVYLGVNPKVSKERLKKRRRNDDTEDGIEKRLEAFRTGLCDRLQAIRETYPFTVVKATGDIDEVNQNIVDKIQTL